MLICLLYAFSCNKTLNKPNNSNFGKNCLLVFLKSVLSPIRMVVQQSALSSTNEFACARAHVCVCVFFFFFVCVCVCVCACGLVHELETINVPVSTASSI